MQRKLLFLVVLLLPSLVFADDAPNSYSYQNLLTYALNSMDATITQIANYVIQVAVSLAFLVMVVMYLFIMTTKGSREASAFLKDKAFRFVIVLVIVLPIFGGKNLLIGFPTLAVTSSYSFANTIAGTLKDATRFSDGDLSAIKKNAIGKCGCSSSTVSTTSGGSSSGSSGGGGDDYSSYDSTTLSSMDTGGEVGELNPSTITGSTNTVVGASGSPVNPCDTPYKGTGIFAVSCGGDNICLMVKNVSNFISSIGMLVYVSAGDFFKCVLNAVSYCINNAISANPLTKIAFVLSFVLVAIVILAVLGGPAAVATVISGGGAGAIILGLILLIALAGAVAVFDFAAYGAGVLTGLIVGGAMFLITVMSFVSIMFVYQLTFFAYLIKWAINCVIFIIIFIISVVQLPFERGKAIFINAIWSAVSIFLSLTFLCIFYTIGVVMIKVILTTGLPTHIFAMVVGESLLNKTADVNNLFALIDFFLKSVVFVVMFPAIILMPLVKIMSIAFDAADAAVGVTSNIKFR